MRIPHRLVITTITIITRGHPQQRALCTHDMHASSLVVYRCAQSPGVLMEKS